MEPTASFGYWVRRRRKALDLTQAALAHQVGCAEVTIKKIEADERRPSRQIAARLAERLQLAPAERAAFVQAARGELATDRLDVPLPLPPLAPAVAHLPSGTITFLCTDIAGSSQLWEQHPEAMRLALARHDTILRESIAAHEGIVFKSGGDGVYAAFTRAPDALAAALAAQQALLVEPWGQTGPLHVRMALHTGVAEERDGDYFGPPLNRVARLLAVGHGDQILLSRASQELVCDTLPPNVALRDLGTHRLKDLTRPEHIFQVVAPALPADFPPLRSLDLESTNLPAQLTPLIGRERELEQVGARLRRADVRLITLTGPGGIGKTRLALQTAADLLDSFVDGVFFVDLAPISDPALVVATIAQTLGLKEAGGQPLLDSLKRYLREKELLLLLDNFEQIVEAAPLVAELLRAAPALKVLVTSRTPLHLSGEHEFGVPPLTLPDPKQLPSVEQLNQYAAVALFIARARAVHADFQVTNASAPAIAEICHRLDGLPLAIELAAARIKLFPPEELLAWLDRRLPLLTGGPRDLPARQKTLRNTIDWSYHLLDRAQQTLFTRLAVFVGGWTLEAAEAVCNGAGDLGIAIVDGLQSLLDQSLLRQVEGPDGALRFRRLETIREYALERLAASGEAEALRWCHAEYFLRLAEQAEPELRGAEQAIWLARLEVEYDNLRAALQWAAQRGDVEFSARVAGALWRFWVARGPWSEGWARLAEILPEAQAAAPSRSSMWAKVVQGSAVLAFYLGDHAAARQLFEQSLVRYRELGDRLGVAWTLIYYGWLINDGGDPLAARPLLEQSLAICRELGDRQGIGWALARLGLGYSFLGDYAAARPLLEESLALCRAVGDRWGTAWALHLLGLAVGEFGGGDIAAAIALEEESLAISRELRDRRNMAYTLLILGTSIMAQGEYAKVHHLFTEALTLQQEIGDKWGTAVVLWVDAVLSAAQGQAERGLRIESAASALLEAIGAALPGAMLTRFMPILTVSRQTLTADEQARVWAEGRAMTLEQAITYALEGD